MAFILPPLPDKPKLTRKQLDRLSNIFDNAGQVFLGVMVLTPIVNQFDTNDSFMLLSGLVFTLFCWALSLYLAKQTYGK